MRLYWSDNMYVSKTNILSPFRYWKANFDENDYDILTEEEVFLEML